MKTSVLAGLAILLGEAVNAKNVNDRSKFKLPDGVVKFDITGKRAANHPNPRYAKFDRLKKRDDSVEVTLNNEDYSYYSTDIEVGTPGQKIKVLMDTGSSDLWVISHDNPYCTTDQRKIESDSSYVECTDGTFNQEKSSSFQKNDTKLAIQYVDTTGATGTWGTDNVKLGGVTLKDCSIGVGTNANTSQGVLGIGFSAIETTNQGRDGKQYLNVPLLFKSQGFTKSVSYSLWLNDPSSKEGSILFGGVDHKKYSGKLTTLPMAQTMSGVSRPVEMAVYLSEIGLKSGGGDASTVYSGNTPVLLDSGTTLTYLPSEVMQAIGEGLGAEYMRELQSYVIPCKPSGNPSVEFNFNGAKIDVKVQDMTIPLTDQSGSQAQLSDGSDACALAIGPTSDQIIFGDSFLRSAYVVYDLENYEIALAQAKFNQDDSDVEVISSGIPSAEKASGYSSTQADESASVFSVSLNGAGASDSLGASADINTVLTGGVPAGATGSSSSSSHHGGDSDGAKSSKSSSGSSPSAPPRGMIAPILSCMLVLATFCVLV